jgi:hypothetical protein
MNGKPEMRISPHEEEAVRGFLSARKRRPGWTPIAPALRPTSVADGYRLHGAIHERLSAAGDRRLGWKVGSTALAEQKFSASPSRSMRDVRQRPAATLAQALARPLRAIDRHFLRHVDGEPEKLWALFVVSSNLLEPPLFSLDKLKLVHDGSEGEFKLFNRLEGGVCTTFAPRDQENLPMANVGRQCLGPKTQCLLAASSSRCRDGQLTRAPLALRCGDARVGERSRVRER